MRNGPNDTMSSVLQRRGIRPSITVDRFPGQPEEPSIALPRKNFAEELFSNDQIPHEMKLRLMKLYEGGGDSQSFNNGLYGEDYNGMDHDFKGKLSGLYGMGMPAPGMKRGKKGMGGMIGKPMPSTGMPPNKDDSGIDTSVDSKMAEPSPIDTRRRKPPVGDGAPMAGPEMRGGPVGGGSGPIMSNRNTVDNGMRPVSPKSGPVSGGQFDPNKLAMLMQYMNGGV